MDVKVQVLGVSSNELDQFNICFGCTEGSVCFA